LQAARESLVLLKNENNVLPLSKNIESILITGEGIKDLSAHNNLSILCGGWTLNWQGFSGNSMSGTTVLQGIKQTLSLDTSVIFSYWDVPENENPKYAVVVIGEPPYAEGQGDKTDISVSKDAEYLIGGLKSEGLKVITVIISGRPLILKSVLDKSDAIIAAWLPGTEGGQAIADVIFGNYKPSGKLPVSWPRDIKQLPINVGDKNYNPLFPYGYGLSY